MKLINPKLLLQHTLLAASISLLSACAYLSTEPTRFYSLSSAAPATHSDASPSAVSIGLGPLKFPELLDRPQIVSRSGEHSIIRAPHHYWGGTLETEFLQVLADDLQLTLGSNQILVYPWDNRQRPLYQLRGAVTRFDGELGGKVHLQARWQLISSSRDGRELIRGSAIEVATADESYEAYVAALSIAVAELAGEITRCIRGDCTD